MPDVTLTDRLEGPDGGISIGYDLFSGFVLSGIELLGAMGGPEKACTFGPDSLTCGIDAHPDARLRAGFEVGDIVALYAIGGATYARTHVEVAGGGVKFEEDDWRLGWIAGAGAEVLVARNLSPGAEYTYNRLPKERYFELIDSRDTITPRAPGCACDSESRRTRRPDAGALTRRGASARRGRGRSRPR